MAQFLGGKEEEKSFFLRFSRKAIDFFVQRNGTNCVTTVEATVRIESLLAHTQNSFD